MSHRPRAFRNRSTTLTIEASPAITEISLPTTGTTIACLVGYNGLWASYVATPEQIEAKKQPTFITGYGFVSALRETVAERFPGFTGVFIDFKAFWEKLGESGIAMPETMPHREK